MDSKEYQVVILGGGISGIGSALKAAELNLSSIVIEKTSKTGGLWSSVERDGFIFDFGVHGLYAANKENEYIVEYLRKLVEKDGFVETSKKTKILFKGKMLNYPLVPGEFFTHFGIEGFLWALTLLFARLKCFFTGDDWMKNFRDYIVGNFGGHLYKIYFEPYVKKVWGVDPKNLCIESIARRVRRIRVRDFIAQSLKRILHVGGKKSYDGLQPVNFIYPRFGASRIVAALRVEAEKRGAEFLTESQVTHIDYREGKYNLTVQQKNGNEMTLVAQSIVSSIPLPEFLKLLYPEPNQHLTSVIKSLDYRALRILNILIDREKVFDSQWIYFQGNNFSFSRLNEFKNLSPYFCPEGKTSISIEFNCDYEDAMWKLPEEQLLKQTLDQLDQFHGTGSMIRERIIDYFSVHLKYAYPIMKDDTLTHLKQAKEFVSAYPNVFSIGRQGNFCYVNGDECVRMAFDSTERIKANLEHGKSYTAV